MAASTVPEVGALSERVAGLHPAAQAVGDAPVALEVDAPGGPIRPGTLGRSEGDGDVMGREHIQIGGAPDAPQANTRHCEPRTPWARLRRALRTLNRIIGAPDYDGYLAHHRAHHPNQAPMSRDEFARQWMELRYSRPGTRCC